MANEKNKDFNAMLHDSRDMPKLKVITDARSIERYGGNRMYIAEPMAYDEVMRRVPFGKVVTTGEMRRYLAERAGADFADPITAGIFTLIAAWAAWQRGDDRVPYWRILKAKGELNDKYPGGALAQKERLEAEGHSIVQRGRKNIRYFVEDYERRLYDLA